MIVLVDVKGTTIYIDGTEDNLFSIDIYLKGEDGRPKSKYVVRPNDKVYLHVFERVGDMDSLLVKGPDFLITRDMLRDVRPGEYEYYVTLEPGESELEFRVTETGVFIIRGGHHCRNWH